MPALTGICSGHDIQRCLYIPATNLVSAGQLAVLNGLYAGATFKNNFVYTDYENPHIINLDGISSSYTHDISDNVFETVYNSGGANCVMLQDVNVKFYNNVVITDELDGMGLGYQANGTGKTFNCYNNSIYIKGSRNSHDPGWVTEIEWLGSINYRSNICAGSSTIDFAYAIPAATQTIASSGWNAITTCTFANRYGTGITVTADSNTDMPTYPVYRDTSRCLATYDSKKGGAGTSANARTEFLNLNGYNSTTKTQSDTPTKYLVTELVAWVRDGFRPQQAALRHRGKPSDGMPDVGAMPVRTMTRRNGKFRTREMTNYGSRR